MNQEEFDKKYKESVDLVAAHEALSRFIIGKGRLCVPTSPEDDDMLISRALNELKDLRKERNENEVYVVQGRSGIVFSATSNYEEALIIKNKLNEHEHDRGRLGYWKNNKFVLQE